MAFSTQLIDLLEVQLAGPDCSRFRVGLAMPLRGLLALNGHSVLEALVLGADELEAERTSSERPLDLVLFDSSGPAEEASRRIADVADRGLVDAFVGLHTSATLEHVERSVRRPLPYVFVPGHEGTGRFEGYYCAGETPASARPGVEWLTKQRGVENWAILGTDYVWPRAMRNMVREAAPSRGARIGIDVLIPLGSPAAAYTAFADAVARAGADGVILNLPGKDLVTALQALRRRRLDRLVRFSTTLEENVLLAIGGDRTGNLYSMLHSFASLRSDRQLELDDRHRHRFRQEAPVLTNWADHAYDGLRLLTQLERHGHLTPQDLGTHESPATSSPLRQTYRNHLAVAAGTRFEILVSY